jgi:hypothetical protein
MPGWQGGLGQHGDQSLLVKQRWSPPPLSERVFLVTCRSIFSGQNGLIPARRNWAKPLCTYAFSKYFINQNLDFPLVSEGLTSLKAVDGRRNNPKYPARRDGRPPLPSHDEVTFLARFRP